MIEHDVVTCHHCGRTLEATCDSDFEARQVFDFEPIKPSVTEHRAQIHQCPDSGSINQGAFPDGVTQPVQYGSRISSWVIYFSHLSRVN